MKEIIEQLEKPFAVKDINFRVGATNRDKTKGIALAYLDTRAVMNRLDEVFGMFGWYSVNEELNKGGLLTSLWVKINDEWHVKQDGSDYTDVESIKGGISGGLKRAAAQFGIGRYLYDLPNVWVDLKDGKYFALNHFELANQVLPDWAILPEELASVRKKSSSSPAATTPVTSTVTTPATEQPIPTSLEQARVFKCTTGYGKDKLFKDLTETQIKWLAQHGTAAEKAAASFCLDDSSK